MSLWWYPLSTTCTPNTGDFRSFTVAAPPGLTRLPTIGTGNTATSRIAIPNRRYTKLDGTSKETRQVPSEIAVWSTGEQKWVSLSPWVTHLELTIASVSSE
jgi:hypothetical protein